MEYPVTSVAMTGATSSIGVTLIHECLRRGIRVIAFYDFASPRAKRVPDDPLVTRVDCTLSGMRNVDVSGLSADVFLHLAWDSSINTIRNDPATQVPNIGYSLDSVDLAEKLHCHTYMGAGSQAEYGKKDVTLTEDLPMEPDGGYGMAKLCAEQMTRLGCRMKGMRHVWPRIVSTYGPYSPDQTVIYYEIRTLLAGQRPSLSAGDQLWDFLYLEDAVKALLALMARGKDGEAYLVAYGKSVPLREYFLKVRDLIDPELPLGLGDIPYSKDTVMHLSASIEKIRRDTGWEPEVGMEEGLRRTIDWVRSNNRL